MRVVLQRPREGRALLPPVARPFAVLAAVLDAAEQDHEAVALVLVDLSGEERQSFLGALARNVEVPLAPLERRQLAQHLGAKERRHSFGRRRRKRLCEPGASLGQVSADEPEVRDRGGEPESKLDRLGLAGERERGPEVVVLALEGRVHLVDLVSRQRGDELVAQLAEVLGMAAPNSVGLATLGEALDGVFANGREHPEPAVVGAADEAGFDERRELVGRLVTAHSPNGVAREAAAECAQLREQASLGRCKEIVAPPDRRPQRLLALGQVAGTPGREPEPVVEGRHQLRGSQLGGPRRNELDRERQPIQPPADLCHERSRRQLSAGRASPAEEQLFRVSGGQRRYLELVLPVQVEPSATRREHTQTRRAFQQLAHNRRGIQQLLEVVEEQQELAVPQLVVQALLRQPERLCDRGADECRIDERRQPDEPDAVGEGIGELMCRAKGNACLAGTTGAGQRHEPSVASQQGRDEVHFAPASDDRCRGCGQMPTLPNGLRLDVERGVVAQDRALKRPQLRSRLEPELVERVPDLGIGLERGGLPAGAVEPEHQQAAQTLSQWVLDRKALELRQVERETKCQRRLGLILDRRDA